MTSVGARPNNTPTRSPLSGADGQDGRTGFAEAVPQGFQRLAWAAVGVVLALIVLGGIVRVSDSGLGCGPGGSGTRGWPLCNGRLIPGLNVHHVLEYSHRTVASTSGLIIFALAIWAWRRLRNRKTIIRLSVAAAALVLFEGLLGAATVEYDLHETLVAIHLGVAMIILGLLTANARAASGRTTTGEWPKGVKRLAVAAATSVWATIVAGGLMSGTQYYGSSKEYTVGGARLACGREFPTCNGDIFPFGEARLINIHLIHRGFIYLTAILVTMLAIKLLRGAHKHGADVAKPAFLALGILVTQIMLGAMNVWLTKSGVLIIAHLTVGTLLWLVTLWLTISVTGRPRRAAAGPPATSHP
ncbi:MAG: COX15/CtaA family protein [Actinobacteria bacterium]|nr:COX15/CtaA family protein [Actinomycetota bacterium]